MKEEKQRRPITTNRTPQAVSPVNGVDRDKLFQTIDQIKAKPGLAKFFKIRNGYEGSRTLDVGG
jgi:hypothetical protein